MEKRQTMTADEYVERLIDDINKSVEIRGRVRSVETQILLTPLHNDMQEFVSALNVGEFDTHLDIIAQFVDNGLISHKHGERLDINRLLADLNKNREKIIRRIDYILDDNLISMDGQSVSEMMAEQFEWVHRYSH
jgi:hypothetical protein